MGYQARVSAKWWRDPGSERRCRDSAVFLYLFGFLIFLMSWMAGDVIASSIATDRAALEARIESLRARAAERGSVRVIVSVTSAERGAETASEIEAVKEQLADRLRGPDAPTIEPIEGTPYIVLELTPRGVELLAADPSVQNIQEDRPEQAQ